MPTTKKQVAAVLTDKEHAAVAEKARAANLTIGNWLRVKIGLQPLKQGRPPGHENRAKKEKQNDRRT
jgi:hypothetical protein